jgi:predicted MPP superfamily phosphohydrolase
VLVPNLEYDLCVITGDYRAATSGPFDAAIDGMRRLRSRLQSPVYAVLGDHDTIQMVTDLEDMRIRMLMNECESISRGGHRIFWRVSTGWGEPDCKAFVPGLWRTDGADAYHRRQPRL